MWDNESGIGRRNTRGGRRRVLRDVGDGWLDQAAAIRSPRAWSSENRFLETSFMPGRDFRSPATSTAS